MRLAYLAFTETGKQLADRLADALGGTAMRCNQPLSLEAWTSAQFSSAGGLIFVGAVGIAVRAIAPHLKHKATDPAVVAVDEGGRFAVPLLSGHLGGANDLARQIAPGVRRCASDHHCHRHKRLVCSGRVGQTAALRDSEPGPHQTGFQPAAGRWNGTGTQRLAHRRDAACRSDAGGGRLLPRPAGSPGRRQGRSVPGTTAGRAGCGLQTRYPTHCTGERACKPVGPGRHLPAGNLCRSDG